MAFDDVVRWVVRAIDVAGVAAIGIGAGAATILFLRRMAARAEIGAAYRRYRQGLGKSILLGLEFLIASDIIRTVLISPTLGNVAVLGLIVLVRTFLSMTLEVELTGRWPWRRAERSRADAGSE